VALVERLTINIRLRYTEHWCKGQTMGASKLRWSLKTGTRMWNIYL